MSSTVIHKQTIPTHIWSFKVVNFLKIEMPPIKYQPPPHSQTRGERREGENVRTYHFFIIVSSLSLSITTTTTTVAMASKNYSLFLLPLVFLVVVSSVSADADLSGLLSSLSNQGSVESLQEGMQCVKKLVPCKSFLNNVSSVAPEMCCSSLKGLVSDDFECLCRFYNEPEILQNLNITRNDARQLPKACNVRLRLSKCKRGMSLIKLQFSIFLFNLYYIYKNVAYNIYLRIELQNIRIGCQQFYVRVVS